MLYRVTATRTTERGEWRGSEQLPTFFLDSTVQGIVSVSHAYKIAHDIVGNDAKVTVVEDAR